MIHSEALEERRKIIQEKNDALARKRVRWIRSNPYYYKLLLNSLRFIIEENSRVLHVRCSIGYILDALKPAYGVGVDDSPAQVEEAKSRYGHLNFFCQNTEDLQLNETFDYILINTVEDIVDIKAVLDGVRQYCHPQTRVIVVSYNSLWEPLVTLAEKTRMRIPQNLHNWVSTHDIKNFLELSYFERIMKRHLVLYPFRFPLLADFFNRFIARLPGIRHLCFLNITIARPVLPKKQDYAVSVIVPCKNEAGNVEEAVNRIPQMGSHTEIIFCDDKSTDGTADVVKEMMQKHPDKDIKLYDGPGISKSENVWVGFDKAEGDILMILDADLTVIPEELPYFYEAISTGTGEFINGSRLVYPMQKRAMRFLNMLGNKFFGAFFSYILDTNIKDTLCGTKVLWKKDYERIRTLRGSWGIRDRWGDYELIFGASKRHLKIIDLPVHYTERTYGETKMTNRLKNGWVMLKMCLTALRKIKFHK